MKLLVSDFDLTFFDDNYDNNIEMVNEFVDNGNIFVIATGRPYGLLKKDIESKKIKYSYLICTDGAVILDNNDNVISQNFIANDIINKIIDLLKTNYHIKYIYIDQFEHQISGLYALLDNDEELSSAMMEICHNYDVNCYLSSHGINVMHKNINKIDGIEYVKELLKIENNDICVIGDNINDLEMIKKYNGYLVDKIGKENYKVRNFEHFMEINESNFH